MAYLTGNGETYIIDVMRGQADGSGTLTNPLGFNRVGVWGSTAGAADALIGSFQTPTWAVPSGTSYMYNQSDISFTIPADTVVKGIALYCTTIYATTSIAFSSLTFLPADFVSKKSNLYLIVFFSAAIINGLYTAVSLRLVAFL